MGLMSVEKFGGETNLLWSKLDTDLMPYGIAAVHKNQQLSTNEEAKVSIK